MSDELSLNSVNANYLDKVMVLAEEMDVEATEDIFDARGMKLVAKGTRISRNLQEKLILHRLRKPLESSIAVEGGIDNLAVMNEAELLIDKVLPILYMCKAISDKGPSPQKILKQIKFGNAMSMMLTITERGGQAALAHSVTVSIIAICLAKKLNLSESDQATVALAGLLHDIGELYIAPEYLTKRSTRLQPHEWRHVVVHPRIGQMLIEELEKCPTEVARAVSEHHERFDGGGYPRQIAGKNISIHGQILSVAETMSGVFHRSDRQLERAELALKIIPGEHPRELVSAISSVLRLSQKEQAHNAEEFIVSEMNANVIGIYENINSSLHLSNQLLNSNLIKSKQAKEILLRAVQQAMTIKRAFSSTGLDQCLAEGVNFDDKAIRFEIDVASREIQWRLRDIARNLALQSSLLSPEETNAFQSLILMFDEGKAVQ